MIVRLVKKKKEKKKKKNKKVSCSNAQQNHKYVEFYKHKLLTFEFVEEKKKLWILNVSEGATQKVIFIFIDEMMSQLKAMGYIYLFILLLMHLISISILGIAIYLSMPIWPVLFEKDIVRYDILYMHVRRGKWHVNNHSIESSELFARHVACGVKLFRAGQLVGSSHSQFTYAHLITYSLLLPAKNFFCNLLQTVLHNIYWVCTYTSRHHTLMIFLFFCSIRWPLIFLSFSLFLFFFSIWFEAVGLLVVIHKKSE